jgi:hypothetical protein
MSTPNLPSSSSGCPNSVGFAALSLMLNSSSHRNVYLNYANFHDSLSLLIEALDEGSTKW